MPFWKRSPPQTYEDPEPLRPVTAPPATPIARKPANKPQPRRLELEDPKADSARKNFDPYNSGVFDRRHTWEKVTRK